MGGVFLAAEVRREKLYEIYFLNLYQTVLHSTETAGNKTVEQRLSCESFSGRCLTLISVSSK